MCVSINGIVANWARENRRRVGEIRWGLTAFGAVMVIVSLFGCVRLNLAPTSEMDGTVRLVGITSPSLGTLSERMSERPNTSLASPRTMVAQVPVKHVATLYTLFGRWLEWVFVAGFLFVVAWSLVAGRQAA